MHLFSYRTHLASALFIGLAAALIALPQSQAEQKAKRLEIRRTLDYLLYLPDRYANAESLPMIVFLHGAGERGNDIQKVKKHGPPKIVESNPDFEFIVLSPQCPAGQRWNPQDVLSLVNHVLETHKVDRQRIYLTGLSMGGYGTWDTAVSHPYAFAAIAPICGGGNPLFARKIRHLPIWVFHGAKDKVVPLSQSKTMVQAVQKAGGNPKFTIYPEAGHDSWTESYANPELYKWFLKHKKSTTKR